MFDFRGGGRGRWHYNLCRQSFVTNLFTFLDLIHPTLILAVKYDPIKA